MLVSVSISKPNNQARHKLVASNFICVKLVKRLLVKVFGRSTAIDTWVFVCEKLFKSISNPRSNLKTSPGWMVHWVPRKKKSFLQFCEDFFRNQMSHVEFPSSILIFHTVY